MNFDGVLNVEAFSTEPTYDQLMVSIRVRVRVRPLRVRFNLASITCSLRTPPASHNPPPSPPPQVDDEPFSGTSGPTNVAVKKGSVVTWSPDADSATFNAGWAIGLGATACSVCPAGTYQPTPGAATCASCPAGSVSTAEGATNVNGCTACASGQYQSGPSECTACLAGRYQVTPNFKT